LECDRRTSAVKPTNQESTTDMNTDVPKTKKHTHEMSQAIANMPSPKPEYCTTCGHKVTDLVDGYWTQYPPIPAEKPTKDEITRQAGLQSAKSHKWNGWDCKGYQTSITRQNHHISKIEAQAAQLAEALRMALD